MALLLAMMPFAASAQETHVVQEQVDSLLSPSIVVNRHFYVKDLNGKLWTEQSLKGHKVVINAWYSGCGPCLQEMPILSEWKNKYPNVIFLSVNFEKADKVRKITEARGFNWTHLYGDNYFVKFVGSGGFPLFIVLGEDGLIRYMVNGTNEKIRQDILNVINK